MNSISIVIPCFNKAEYIAETVISVFSQSSLAQEVLIINDGSTDQSATVISHLKSQYPLISIYDKSNGGISDARNFGISKAKGEYITVLDADDKIDPLYLENIRKIIASTDSNLISCHVSMFGESSGSWSPESYDPYLERYHNVLPTLVTYRRDIFEKSGGYSNAFVFNEDWDFFVRAEDAPLKVFQIPQPLFLYRVTQSGLAQEFIKDTWEYSVSLIMTSSEKKYPIEKLLKAHASLSMMPERWFKRFNTQLQKFPEEWLLNFWLGLANRSRGEIELSKSLLLKSLNLTSGKNWQPWFQLADMYQIEGDEDKALEALHYVRLLRADMDSLVLERVKKIKER